MARVIVVGGGLSGLSAAHTVLERGGSVLLLDKNNFLGGNSTKATSGINGALTRTQIKLGIPDTVDSFYADTALSARDLIRPELVKVLTGHSASAVEWLQDKFKLDLSLVSRLGGHSHPRTHRGKERFPGMTITYALMEKIEDLAASEPQKVVVLKKARVTRLLQDASGGVTGVEFEHEGRVQQAHGPVVLATGGYAADFTESSLLKKYRPDIYHLPTTNGDYSTGDGIKMATAIGATAIDLEKVQVHPTGLVDPNEPDAKVKFLAAEALRGVGGLLLNNQGKRFCDELGHRDYVTGKIWEDNKGPYRLVLNGASAKEIEWHCRHYQGRNLMKHFRNGGELAREIGISPAQLEQTFRTYNDIAAKKNDPFGKKFFEKLPWQMNDEFWVAIITPVLHYTMGGLNINDEGVVQSQRGAINGLFAAGELAGGVHGANRLGGSSLLGCVVFGRVAGASASRHLLQSLAAGRAAVGGGGAPTTRLELHPDQKRLVLEVNWGADGTPSVSSGSAAAAAAPSSSPAAATTPAKSSAAPAAAAASAKAVPNRTKEYTLEEVAKHNTEKDCWVVVNGEVLDVTKFLPDHPGGKKAILIYAGRDATEEFNMLHKPDVVEKYAPECIVGKLKGGAGGHGAPKAKL